MVAESEDESPCAMVAQSIFRSLVPWWHKVRLGTFVPRWQKVIDKSFVPRWQKVIDKNFVPGWQKAWVRTLCHDDRK